MSTQIPSQMRALTVPHYGKPSEYDISSLPTPQIIKPDDMLVKVYAASMNPGEVKMATGITKLLLKDVFPYQMGYDVAGIVVALGTGVHSFRIGDAIFAQVPMGYRGTFADYVLVPSYCAALKPSSQSFAVAASIPIVGITAFKALQIAEATLPGGLKDKTVLIPAGLSGTGHIALQMAKNVFGAGKVITTLSTAKIPLFNAQFKETVADQIIDYTSEDVINAIGRGKVDFLMDTMGEGLKLLPVIKKGGVVVSISMTPSGTELKKSLVPDLPWILRMILDLVYWVVDVQMRWKGVSYSSIMSATGNGETLEEIAGWVSAGKVKPVVGRKAKWDDLDEIKAGAQQLLDGKGGIGKFVIVMEDE